MARKLKNTIVILVQVVVVKNSLQGKNHEDEHLKTSQIIITIKLSFPKVNGHFISVSEKSG